MNKDEKGRRNVTVGEVINFFGKCDILFMTLDKIILFVPRKLYK